jgi:WhiB family redox-sensing transcriptional regulator
VKWLISPLQMAKREGFRVVILEQLMARLYLYAMAETSRLPRPVADEWEWQYQGACRDLPSEMFFHPDGERGPRRRNRENTAKAVCASCPVIAACRAHALAVQEPYGIWGGLSEDDRLAIINKPIGISQATLTHAS